MTSQQNDPKRHHFVPRFYLEQWTNHEGKLARYGKLPNGKVTMDWRVPKSVGCEVDLYTFPELGEAAVAIEKGLLQKLDDRAAKVIQRMIDTNGEELSGGDMVWFSHFLLSLLVRNPESVAALKEAALAMWEAPTPQTQADYDNIKGPNDPATLEEWLEADSDIGGHQLGQTLLQSLMMNANVGEHLRRMHWHVCAVPPGSPPLLTSDRPLFSSNGLVKENGQLILPLGPRHFFAAFTHKEYAEQVMLSPADELVDMARKLATVRAQKFVYASTPHEKEFVAKWLAYEQVASIGETLAKGWQPES
jgi:hypothetical protein